MREKELFKRRQYFDITAATLGISREDWYCYKNGMTQAEISQTMLAEKFDIVPIEKSNGEVLRYYKLVEASNGTLETCDIQADDKLYYATQIGDVISIMNKNKKTHYFLTNLKSNNDILGLISLTNFNNREFYVYLYSLISYVEKELSSLILSNKDQAFEILDKKYDESDDDNLKEQWSEIKRRYRDDMSKSNENNYKEYLYINQINCLIAEEGGFKKLGYTKAEIFLSGTGIIKGVRNGISHPVKSLVKDLNDLKKIEKSLIKLYELTERLENNKIKHG